MPSIVATLAAVIAVSQGPAWALDHAVERALAQGHPWSDVVPSTQGASLVRAVVDIKAPAKTVWAVMNDCRLMSRMITSMTSCKVIDGDMRQGWDVREQITRGNMFVPTIRNVVRGDYQPYRLIRFHRVGGDLKIEDGEWRLEALGKGESTRVTYTNRVAVDILAPAFLVREGLKRDTAKVLANLRRESMAVAAHIGG